MQELGIGVTYVQGLERLIESHFSLINVIEVEPQTLWNVQDEKCDSFSLNREQNDLLKSYAIPKIFHGVGYPIGGSVLPSHPFIITLLEHIEELQPVWFTEHLSFNRYFDGSEIVNTNFLLPPLQTEEGINTAVAAINNYKKKLYLPFAFETGANYLKPRKHELPDGFFVRHIADKADCNILLDVHNLWTNQQNGRQSITDFINQLDLERISEIHVAAGFYHRGYYLDAHSGVPDPEFMTIVERIVKELPALKAIIFEIMPEYLQNVEDKEIKGQLERMNGIWEKRGRSYIKKTGKTVYENFESHSKLFVGDWERTLGKLAIGFDMADSELSSDLLNDKGMNILNELIFHSRASLLISSLKFTVRLLRLTIGKDVFNNCLVDFFKNTNPSLFPYSVAKKFLTYLSSKKEYEIKYLDDVAQFEIATIRSSVDKKIRKLHLDFDLFAVLEALSKFELPQSEISHKEFFLEIRPDGQLEVLVKQPDIAFSL